MSTAATVNETIDRIPPGRIFGYEVFPEYQKAPEAVVRAVGRRVGRQGLKRLAKGRFYTPKQGVLGELPISDAELLRDALYRGNRRIGYITGPALYNRLGLTTQVPKTVAVASNRAAQTKDFGTIRIKMVPRHAPINDSTIPLLETLDVLRDAKNIQDADIDNVLQTLAARIKALAPAEQRKLQRLALDFYNAGTRALLGVLITRNQQDVLPALGRSINPTTHFKFGIDPNKWPEATAWNIRRSCTSHQKPT